MLRKYLAKKSEIKLAYIVVLLFFGTILLVLPEIFLYKGWLQSAIGISINTVVFILLGVLTLLRVLGFKFNSKIFFFYAFIAVPVLLSASIIFTLLNNIIHANYIYGLFHIYVPSFYELSFISIFFLIPLFDTDVLRKHWRIAIFSFGIIAFCLYVYLKWSGSGAFYRLDEEDGFIEYAQSILYFASSFLALLSIFKLKKLKIKSIIKKVWLILFVLSFLGLFILGGEEISWGQRVFNLQTPGNIAAKNYQNEITLHNLENVFEYVYNAYLILGLYGISSWLVVYVPLKFKGVFLYEYLKPFLSKWYLVPYFAVMVGYVIWRFNATDNSFDIWEEAAEIFPAIAIFIIFLRDYICISSKTKTS